jgi:DNA-directed RNA polymerase specialized sigma24 family protein
VTDAEELLAVHDALERLERIDPSLAQTVDMRFFCGFTFEEIARVHGVTERTAQRRWEKARLYLRAALSNAPGADAETRE